LDLKITFDTLTGASPTGAVPQPTVQTYTRPSGEGSYQVDAGVTPLDDTFKDTRVQLNAQWTQPVADDYTVSTGAHFSKEFDYLSLGFNGTIARDFNQKNTTVSAGFSFSHDSISPEGGRPFAFASMPTGTGESDDDDDGNEGEDEHDQSRQNGDGSKNIVDVLFGVTQVINRQTIMQFNYSYSASNGYLTDPFKMLSVVDNQGLTQDLLFENRPDKRTKHSFYWQTKYHFGNDAGFAPVLDFSYRYMTDSWDIASHTLDTKLRFDFDNGTYLEPHVRYYQQSGAEFYQPFLNQGQQLPSFASADHRIGEFTAYTVGVKYGVPLASGDSMAFRIEYYQQDPSNSGYDKPGVLQSYDLNPSLSAIILQMSYSF
ncbi:MAG: DUF3570 domain-containing protein, partial [Psychrosphaera sp.]|nr:DUF3570 domain-containing protein [Psychrosphaera sp.]